MGVVAMRLRPGQPSDFFDFSAVANIPGLWGRQVDLWSTAKEGPGVVENASGPTDYRNWGRNTANDGKLVCFVEVGEWSLRLTFDSLAGNLHDSQRRRVLFEATSLAPWEALPCRTIPFGHYDALPSECRDLLQHRRRVLPALKAKVDHISSTSDCEDGLSRGH